MANKRQSGFRISVELTGVNETLRDAKAILDPKKRLALVKKALRAGGALLLKYIRQQLRRHDRTGWLRKNMISKLKYYKRQDVLVLILGVKSNASTTVTVERRSGGKIWQQTKRITAHNYAHLVMFPRRAFTQQFTYTNKLGNVVKQQRKIGSYSGDNVIESATKLHGATALAKIRDVIQTGIGNGT